MFRFFAKKVVDVPSRTKIDLNKITTVQQCRDIIILLTSHVSVLDETRINIHNEALDVFPSLKELIV
jgi:hypothetical protein